MYYIRKKFSFSAAHQLFGLRKDHPCGRLHGHNYEVELVLGGVCNQYGFVVDYRELDELKRMLDDRFDHRNLNDALAGIQTTAENIARYLFDWCKQRWPETYAVQVSETPKTWATYSPHV